MGLGPYRDGRYWPITTASAPTPMPTPAPKPRVVLPHPVDVRGNPLPPRPRAPGSWT